MQLFKTCWICLFISSIACTYKQTLAQNIDDREFLEDDNELPEIDLSPDEANSRQKRKIFCEESGYFLYYLDISFSRNHFFLTSPFTMSMYVKVLHT